MTVFVRGTGNLKNHTGQVIDDVFLVFSGQFRHVGQIHAGFLGDGNRQGFHCCVHMLNHMLLTNGAFGEHVRFPFQFTVFVQDFQRTEQIVGGIIAEGQRIGAAVDQAERRGIIIIPLVQLPLQCMNRFFAFIVQLRIHQAMDTIPQGHHALDPFLGCRVQFRANHDGVFPVIYFVVDDGIGEILDIRISGNTFLNRFSVCQFWHFHCMVFSGNTPDSRRQLF